MNHQVTSLFSIRVLIGVMVLTPTSWLSAQHHDVERPKAWENLVFGARFMDRFEPIPLIAERTDKTWGADSVKPRDVLNGIEDAEWSYWGGNILKGDDGQFHLFVCRWPENHPKGHKAWPGSEVVRCVSNNRLGPYQIAEVIGKGHNPEAYQLQDGRIVCYVKGAYYLSGALTGPWERKEFIFEPRDRRIIEGLSNLSFAQREDGSFLMVCRGGGMWISQDGLSPWEQVTQGSNYPKVDGRFEDPVLWRTKVQYHLIVNDWYGRIAYYLRSKDGFHWKVAPGEAYMPGIAVSADGGQEDWYKYERIKVFQDQHRRAVQANFAVIDHLKSEDLPNDIHSSKNISIPLTPGRIMTILDPAEITAETKNIRVLLEDEADFHPQTDVDIESLRFGASEEVDFGRGCQPIKAEHAGKNLIVTFDGDGNGFTRDHFAAKLLGRTTTQKLLFAYARLPSLNYLEPALSPRAPKFTETKDGFRIAVAIKNFGQAPSRPAKLGVERKMGTQVETIATGTIPPLRPYETCTVELRCGNLFRKGMGYDLTTVIDKGTAQVSVLTSHVKPSP